MGWLDRFRSRKDRGEGDFSLAAAGANDPGSMVPLELRFFDSGQWLRFVGLVDRELTRRRVRYETLRPAVLRLGDSGQTMGLANLAQMCNAVNEREWFGVVSRHIDRLLEAPDMPHDDEDIRRSLRVRLVPDDMNLNASLRYPFAESVTAVLAMDFPTSVRSVGADDVQTWGMGEDDAWSLAWENTRRDPEPVSIERVDLDRCSLVSVFSESFYLASRVRFVDELVSNIDPLGEHGALVAVPRRHTILVHPLRDYSALTAVEVLVANTRRLHLEGPGSVSAHLYWWCAGTLRWLPASYDEAEARIEFFPPPDFSELLNRLGSGSG